MSMRDPRPFLLLVSLEPRDYGKSVFIAHHLLSHLGRECDIEVTESPLETVQKVTNKPPHAVIVTDGGITQHRDVYATLLAYAREGGLLIFMGTFPKVEASTMKELFQEAGLPWEMAGTYNSETVRRADIQQTAHHTTLKSSYSLRKAVFLRNVAHSDAWYMLHESSEQEDKDQTPIALANIGRGKLGYVGDVKGEDGTDIAVLSMCGMLSEYNDGVPRGRGGYFATYYHEGVWYEDSDENSDEDSG